ncbi:hypothetical protein IW146_008499 [Coemansia sp. RSA 922]|nr:hypothetical protein IW146_008499 [Coemansia sp. RSA 922]
MFQNLPVLVVEMIVEYVGRRARNTFIEDTRKHNNKKVILRPLLYIGKEWRLAVVRSLCDNCQIRLTHFSNSVDIKYPAWPAGHPYPPIHRTNLVKRVVVYAPFCGNLSAEKFNEATARLRGKGDGVVFPYANNLVLILRKPREKRTYSSTLFGHRAPPPPPPPVVPIDPKNVISFARFLLRLVPDASSLSTTFIAEKDVISDAAHPFDMLISELCKGGIKSLQARSYHRCCRVALGPMVITGLTSLTQSSTMFSSAFSALARLNAGTLIKLSVGLYEVADWPSYIHDDQKNATVYPKLTTLIVTVPQGIHIRHETTFDAIEDVVPFPKLVTLDVTGFYPFVDDLFFRGNGETLKNLRLPIVVFTRNVLSRYGVLGRYGVSRMNSVHIAMHADWYMDKYILNHIFLQDDETIERQLPAILEMTTTLVVSSDTKYFHMFNVLSAAPSFTVLQHLTVAKPVYTTMQIIQIVAAIPTLVSFACDLSKKVSGSTEAMPEEELPGALIEKYYPLSKNFKTLRASRGGSVSTNKMAIAAMQIALICPSFEFVDILPGLRKDLKYKITYAMVKDRFKPYTEGFSRLL